MCVSLPTAQPSKSEDYKKHCVVSYPTKVNHSVLWIASFFFFFFEAEVNKEGDVFVALISFSVYLTQGIGRVSINALLFAPSACMQ